MHLRTLPLRDWYIDNLPSETEPVIRIWIQAHATDTCLFAITVHIQVQSECQGEKSDRIIFLLLLDYSIFSEFLHRLRCAHKTAILCQSNEIFARSHSFPLRLLFHSFEFSSIRCCRLIRCYCVNIAVIWKHQINTFYWGQTQNYCLAEAERSHWASKHIIFYIIIVVINICVCLNTFCLFVCFMIDRISSLAVTKGKRTERGKEIATKKTAQWSIW